LTKAAGRGGRAEMERRIIEKGLEDASFRQSLLADPGVALEEELGTVAGGWKTGETSSVCRDPHCSDNRVL
jgi:hypothetical protein